jgi:outer membrane protein OmpA-like peptidoglycan-associated protein
MLDAIADLVKPTSTISIVGYTDALGESEYNFELSEKRASNVRRAIQKKYPAVPVQSRGVGESELLFDQRLQEERFYSRTVIIIIETPK